MKIEVTKIGAARSQLIEAIRLFFEQRDPVSIHTLVGASLQILHDHIEDGAALDENLIFHKSGSIFIKDEYQSLWNTKTREARNFFKHADKDLSKGKTSFIFDSSTTDLQILEAIRCLRIIEEERYVYSLEVHFFTGWLALKYPDIFTDEWISQFKWVGQLNPDDLAYFNMMLGILRENPELVKKITKGDEKDVRSQLLKILHLKEKSKSESYLRTPIPIGKNVK